LAQKAVKLSKPKTSQKYVRYLQGNIATYLKRGKFLRWWVHYNFTAMSLCMVTRVGQTYEYCWTSLHCLTAPSTTAAVAISVKLNSNQSQQQLKGHLMT